ncbi:UDP-N-acetylglucosamine 2-epimerase [Alteribacillus bidgolensis]|uniref:UDP-N-acetylglucosamine 2-epimerase (Non-hydrolysing)/GDP/UDP-N,N'-diacetylbacillosamine 2-epimerase (Hydrolysing) n=1 Tax=Alteribacillus bidgolensis TaxID=930129 RepID=A0A1G8JHM7_9BACI|nr:UDP-N-acetylglucosamine 2-epimerase [Alteribacillus bidgolensis]SDI30632.1 UDP-N-acetylglucosamine 2-epimerase (non-hydrolysing)/GDP/UDP-N,N'-diacetylbacillosamine 2-epimerase (hydrolysing) [Alteribacillus bidgolensis]
MVKRKVCVVTGTRAEYGLLSTLMEGIEKDQKLQLQVVVTGMHLSPEFGLTYKEIEEDGFIIHHKVEMLLSSDTAIGVTKSIGLGIISFADVFQQLQPDIIVLFGDRYEVLAAAQAALIAKVPVAHISGGDTTEGAFDEAIRHSITKMSHLHFVTNKLSWQRVRQLGENPKHIYNVGSLAIERIYRVMRMSRLELEKSLPFSFLRKNLLITFHPVTLENQASSQQLKELLEALDHLGPDFGLIFTKPNADPEGREFIRLLDDFVSTRPNARAFTSLGQLRYFSTIAQVDAVVGNSSSGIYEVPAFRKPTVNIGDRQKGRLQASSVINCAAKKVDIEKAIHAALVKDCTSTVHPYGEGNSSKKIILIIKRITDYKALLKKHFFKAGGV